MTSQPKKPATETHETPNTPVSAIHQPPRIPSSNYELRILQALRRIIRATEIHSQKLIQQHNITGPQLGCLLALIEHGPLPTTTLAHKIYLSPSTVVGIVDRLEEKGLVVRQRSSRDRRQVQVVATEAGQRLAGEAPSPLQESLAVALKELPELERVSTTLSLEKVVDLMEARKIDAAPLLATGPIASSPDPAKP